MCTAFPGVPNSIATDQGRIAPRGRKRDSRLAGTVGDTG